MACQNAIAFKSNNIANATAAVNIHCPTALDVSANISLDKDGGDYFTVPIDLEDHLNTPAKKSQTTTK